MKNSKQTVDNMAIAGGALLLLAVLWYGQSGLSDDLSGLVPITAAMAAVGGLLLGVSGALYFIAKMRSRRQQW